MGNNYKVRGKLPDSIFMPMESCEELLGGLYQPRRDLTNALLAITQAALKMRRFVELAPDQLSAFEQYEQIIIPLETAASLIEESRDSLESTHERGETFWRWADQIRELYRQGKLVLNTS